MFPANEEEANKAKAIIKVEMEPSDVNLALESPNLYKEKFGEKKLKVKHYLLLKKFLF